jgi:hypothetical protein
MDTQQKGGVLPWEQIVLFPWQQWRSTFLASALRTAMRPPMVTGCEEDSQQSHHTHQPMMARFSESGWTSASTMR